MEANQFVEKLRSLPPIKEDFIKALKKKYIEGIHLEIYMKNYFIESKSEVTDNRNPLLDFVSNFKTDDVKIGGLTFYDSIILREEYPGKLFFAEYEGDFVGLDSSTGIVESISYEGAAYPSQLADSSGQFLDALIVIAELRLVSLVTEGPVKRQVLDDYVKRAAIAAGGEYYADVYLALCGIFVL